MIKWCVLINHRHGWQKCSKSFDSKEEAIKDMKHLKKIRKSCDKSMKEGHIVSGKLMPPVIVKYKIGQCL
jgi:hypothetical protein